MIKKLTFWLFLIALFDLCNDLKAQIINISVEPQTFFCPSIPKDTISKVFIYGRVTRSGEPKNYIAKANVQLKDTDLSISTDSLGYYWLDISEISDASKNYIIQCSFVNYQAVEKTIDHKIEKNTAVNFELELNGGIAGPNIIVRDCFKGAGTEDAYETKKKKKRWWRK